MERSKRQILATVAICATFAVAVNCTVATLQKDPPAEAPTESRPAQQTASVASEPPVIEEVDKPEIIPLDPDEVEMIGRTIWGEAGGVKSEAERAAVAWCILNRVDAYGQTVEEVVTAPRQFQGYRTEGVCPAEHLELAIDVLTRWNQEKAGVENVGRTLPADYLYFVGDGDRNYFSIKWMSREKWDWSLDNPYIQ